MNREDRRVVHKWIEDWLAETGQLRLREKPSRAQKFRDPGGASRRCRPRGGTVVRRLIAPTPITLGYWGIGLLGSGETTLSCNDLESVACLRR